MYSAGHWVPFVFFKKVWLYLLLWFQRKSSCIYFCQKSIVVFIFVFFKKVELYLRRTYFQINCDSELLLNFVYNSIWMPLNSERWTFRAKDQKEAIFCSIMRSDSMTGLVWRLHELSKLVPRNFPVSVQIGGFYHLLKSENISCLQFFLWHLYLVGLQFLAKLPHHGPQLTWIWYQWFFSILDV